jgi:hypothetical protein
MNVLRFRLTCGSLLIALPCWVMAQPMDAGKKELAARVILTQQAAIDNTARGIANQTAQQVLQAASQAMDQIPAAHREQVGKEVQADVRQFHDEVEQALLERAAAITPAVMGPMLEDKFSEDELRQVVTWLESPAARKYAQLSPEMGAALQQQLISDTRPTVEPKLRALEELLRKKLTPSPGSAPSPAAKAAGTPAKAAPTSKTSKSAKATKPSAKASTKPLHKK